MTLTCPACGEEFAADASVSYENGGRESPSGWTVEWNDLPDGCLPACGYVFTAADIDAFANQAIDAAIEQREADYNGPTEPEDLE